MRVLHVYSGNLYGGVEAMLSTLARRRAASREMETEFALCFEGRLARELREAGATVYDLGAARFSRPWTVMRARLRLSRLLREEPFDVVVCHSPWSLSLFGIAVRRNRLPMGFWLHDAVSGQDRFEQLAQRTPPDLALCTSRYAAATLPNIFPGMAGEVLYCPVEAPPPGLRAERAAVRAELRTPEDAVAVVQVSRMEAWKGHRLHLEALGRLREVPGWVCWLVGGAQRPHEEAHLAEMRALAGTLGIASRVRFVGERADVRRILAAADVACQPNLGPEPFGITFVEALFAGLPVVATRLGGAPEVVDDSCGILVPPEDPDALADALRRLVGDAELRRRLGAAGPRRARELCDVSGRVKQLHRLLAGIAGRRRAA